MSLRVARPTKFSDRDTPLQKSQWPGAGLCGFDLRVLWERSGKKHPQTFLHVSRFRSNQFDLDILIVDFEAVDFGKRVDRGVWISPEEATDTALRLLVFHPSSRPPLGPAWGISIFEKSDELWNRSTASRHGPGKNSETRSVALCSCESHQGSRSLAIALLNHRKSGKDWKRQCHVDDEFHFSAAYVQRQLNSAAEKLFTVIS